ncbi:ABC transporter ATP-binding protein [Actinoplanes utahensis]|uniref:Fatty acid ABC transporter ATP-binding/permease protein n=1 Tax=Actinoplanes utahensis TaxID=1869 RepID=A0A0A6XCV4_ACTUT|nr:multidrug ABC transporter ATP-binding protein [Actinoplanes utahensis]GIF32413.1 multidrug ABC transporter ATP-binding protein [Actinoplanes utahensis]
MNAAPARRLLARLRPYRWRVLSVAALAVGAVGVNVWVPRLLGMATDVVFAGVIGDTDIDFGRLALVLAATTVVCLVAGALQWVQARMLAEVVGQAVRDLRRDVEEKLHRLPVRYFDHHPRGELLSRVTNDVDNIAHGFQQVLGQLLTATLTLTGVLAMMLVISPLLAAVAVVVIPLSVLITRAVAKRSQQQFRDQWRHAGSLHAHIDEIYTGHELVTAYGRWDEAGRVFADRNDALHRAAYRAQFTSGLIAPATMFIGNLLYVVVAVVGGLWVAAGTMSLGEVQAFIHYCRQFSQPISQIASTSNLLQSGLASAERVFDLLDAGERRPDPVAADRPRAPLGRVVFERVSFRYEPDQPLIEDLSLTVEPGSTVAVVGPTGAGKTTLVNLLMRFYELDSGRILLDGADLTTLRRADLRGRISMVLQDVWLFHGTIRENIAYGRPDADDEQVLRAARAASVDHFVRTLPDGYDTVLDADTGTLSAGQRQLITIARAHLADPKLLILDEATSLVDTRTEALVQQAMTALRAGRTSFVIAHRLSTVRDADLILVMDRGRIVEQGDHASLLAAGGLYRDLHDAHDNRPVTRP